MKWLAVLPVIAAAILATAWALMLLFGVLHHEISEAIPAIGYGPAVAISATFSLYGGVKAAFSELAKEILK